MGPLVPRDQLQARGACPGHKDQGPLVSGTPEPSPREEAAGAPQGMLTPLKAEAPSPHLGALLLR